MNFRPNFSNFLQNSKVFFFLADQNKNYCRPKMARKPDRGLFDQNSLDQNCVFSVDQKFHNQLIKFFETFQLIECTVG